MPVRNLAEIARNLKKFDTQYSGAKRAFQASDYRPDSPKKARQAAGSYFGLGTCAIRAVIRKKSNKIQIIMNLIIKI